MCIKQRVLLVEDNPVTLMSLSLFLKDSNYELIGELMFGEEIENFIQNENVDILVTDIMLKGAFTGIDAVKKLRKKGLETPVIFVSALSDDETITEIEKLSKVDYLTKPYKYEALRQKLINASRMNIKQPQDN